MKFTIIIPPVTCHNLDPHSGFPFIPHMAAYLAAELNKFSDVQIIDSFSDDPNNSYLEDNFIFLGLDIKKIVKKINKDSDGIFIYARTVIDFKILTLLISAIKNDLLIPIIIFENSQCVDALSLESVYKELLLAKADIIIFGEPENRANEIAALIRNKKYNKEIKGIAHNLLNNKPYYNNNTPFDNEIDKFTFPLWEKWNLDGYWKINYAHPPIKKKDRFVTLITSRGCPFKCTFCVAPKINPNWRYRTAKNVVDEIEYFNKKLNINDFHISDFNPTINEKRFVEICNEIINRKINITWKVAQGTKIETIKNNSTIDLFYRSGCRFLSFSPESGSERIMHNFIKKPFNYEFALEKTKIFKKNNIRTQACFVIGMPGEDKYDRKLSLKFMIKLAKAGLDEVACYIITPVPGSKIFDQITGYSNLSECSHTPIWRKDIKELLLFRKKFYLTFLIIKFVFHPFEFLRICYALLSRNFETKMEMSLYKKYKLYKLYLQAKYKTN